MNDLYESFELSHQVYLKDSAPVRFRQANDRKIHDGRLLSIGEEGVTLRTGDILRPSCEYAVELNLSFFREPFIMPVKLVYQRLAAGAWSAQAFSSGFKFECPLPARHRIDLIDLAARRDYAPPVRGWRVPPPPRSDRMAMR